MYNDRNSMFMCTRVKIPSAWTTGRRGRGTHPSGGWRIPVLSSTWLLRSPLALPPLEPAPAEKSVKEHV